MPPRTATRARPLVLLALTFYVTSCAPRPKSPAEESHPTRSPAALKQGDLRTQVDALLARSAPLEEWRKLGPETLDVLEQVFNDPAAQPEQRTRALIAIGHLEQPAAMDRVKAIARDPNADVRYRATAVAALGHRGGQAVIPDLKQVLGGGEPALRQAAARALGNVGGEAARSPLEEHLSKEEDPAVREVIQQSLTKLQP
jgi:HEAT repeat protein